MIQRLLMPVWAVTAVTWREALRQRLWILVGLAGLVLLAAIPNMQAVDPAGSAQVISGLNFRNRWFCRRSFGHVGWCGLCAS